MNLARLPRVAALAALLGAGVGAGAGALGMAGPVTPAYAQDELIVDDGGGDSEMMKTGKIEQMSDGGYTCWCRESPANCRPCMFR